MTLDKIRLTQYSHGAGCGCKISPQVLKTILAQATTEVIDPRLLVGNSTLDDAAVYAIDDEKVLISTTDFFMPIVDDPYDFGGIAAVNAISDIYAMGGQPLMAIAILVWPIGTIPEKIAGQVLEGAKRACAKAGIAVAGGHSIDGPEPIFGLAVTGIANIKDIKKNSSATVGCELFLTKPIGVGILTTAQKKGLLKEKDLDTALESMLSLNKIGQDLGQLDAVKAMTDITGFGLLGHLNEMCEGSGVSSIIHTDAIPHFADLDYYINKETIPGGTHRNYASYGHKIAPISDYQKVLLCDPQTSGGLLVAVEPSGRDAFIELTKKHGLTLKSFGTFIEKDEFTVYVK